MAKDYKFYNSDSNFEGPFKLTKEILADKRFDNSGNYILADSNFFGAKKIKYVGRGDLRNRLTRRIGKYQYFYFKINNNDSRSFHTECREFHRYGKANYLDNKVHPARPEPQHKYPLCTEVGCNGEAK